MLFYGISSPQFSASPGDVATALAQIDAKPNTRVCFHIHWLNALFKEANNRNDGFTVFDEFLTACSLLRERGGVIAWTVHNVQEHESPDPSFELAFRRKLVAITDVVIVHGQEARRIALETFGAAPERVLSVAHGSFIGVYEDAISRSEAQKITRAPPRDTIFVNVGLLRPYKGLADLIASVEKIERNGASVGLLIAGAASDRDKKDLTAICRASSSIRISVGQIADNDLQNYLNAADFAVLPYKNILTSSSAVLALSFGLPVIAPAMAGLVELIQDGVNGFLYDPEHPQGLEQALLRAADTDRARRARMSEAAFVYATSLRWSEGRRAFINAIAATEDRRGSVA